MNYYKRHLGDYHRDTGHLSALEHGIYNLLLDWYYINEKPIPDDKANRIAKSNRTETETVLKDFFKLTEEGWVHSRIDREIADFQTKSAANKEIGKLGGRPRKENRNGLGTLTERKPKGTQAISHKPVTSNQEKKQDQELLPPPVKPVLAAADVLGTLPLNNGSDYQVTKAQAEEFQKLYPAVEVRQEFRAMKGWLIANPTKRKTKSGILRFVNAWLAKEQNKGGSYNSHHEPAALPPMEA